VEAADQRSRSVHVLLWSIGSGSTPNEFRLVSGLGFRVSEFRVFHFGFEGFEFRVSGFRFRVLGCRVSGFGVRGLVRTIRSRHERPPRPVCPLFCATVKTPRSSVCVYACLHTRYVNLKFRDAYFPIYRWFDWICEECFFECRVRS